MQFLTLSMHHLPHTEVLWLRQLHCTTNLIFCYLSYGKTTLEYFNSLALSGYLTICEFRLLKPVCIK